MVDFLFDVQVAGKIDTGLYVSLRVWPEYSGCVFFAD
jgi:hypothetical protein